MGLNTTHGCWRGAYPAFYRWRTGLMELTGMFTLTPERWDYIGPPGRWDEFGALGYLMSHDDCGGTIEREWQLPLAETLERLIDTYPDADWGGHIGPWHAKTRLFSDGLREAYRLNEPVGFY